MKTVLEGKGWKIVQDDNCTALLVEDASFHGGYAESAAVEHDEKMTPAKAIEHLAWMQEQ